MDLAQMQQTMGSQPPTAPTGSDFSLAKMRQIMDSGNPTPDQSAAALGHSTGMLSKFINSPITQGVGKFVGGVVNAAEQPFASLAATPVQLGVAGINKLAGTHIPDPYAKGIPSLGGNIPISGLNLEQKAGDVLKAGSEVAGIAAAPETLGGSMATFGAVGAAQAGGQAMQNKGSVTNVAKKAFLGGLTGTVLGGVGYGVQKGLDYAVSKGPSALMNNALKISKKIKMAGDSPADFLNDEGVWGSLGSIQKQVTDGAGIENAAIKQAAVSAQGGLAYDDVVSSAMDKLKQSGLGDLFDEGQLKQLVESVPISRLKSSTEEGGITNWVDVDGVRSSLGNLIGDSKWLQDNPTERTQAYEAVYNALSEAEKKATGTANNFARLSNFIRANKAVSGAIVDADNKWGLNLMDTMSGTVGATVGAAAGGPVGAGIGAVTGAGIERAAKSATAQTGIAQLLSRVPLVGGALGRAASTLVAGQEIGK